MKNIVSIAGIIGTIAFNIPVFAQNYINTQKTCIQVHIKQKNELSAIGIKWQGSIPHYIQYIDPNCDLVQQLKIGDVLIAIDNKEPVSVWHTRQNYGSQNTLVNLTISRGGYILNFTCHRKPVSYFSTWFRQGMLPI